MLSLMNIRSYLQRQNGLGYLVRGKMEQKGSFLQALVKGMGQNTT